MDKLLFGAAYYEEYLPYDRLEQDIAMMKKAGINTVRVAESTWSTWEPQEGVFDFSRLERVLDAMEEAGIGVIVGTPTYAVPTWLVRAHPEVLAITHQGQSLYGHRQNMDITNPHYLFYSERIIRELMKRTAHRKCVIGFQLDNETKPYDTCGPNVQRKFVAWLKERFRGDLEAMNRAFGLDYWSNRINAWEDFPDVRGTINGSLGAEFEKFQRSLVEDLFRWQRAIVDEYRRADQFVTHNFDYEWRGYSCGIHPEVDQYRCAQALTVAGTDIYHPGQEDLTGREIAFGGDVMRSLKGDNYLVLETQAQAYPNRTPYPGQLRLQAYSHIASGANSVLYWHWHSIHNACESYWKGLLSHDFAENETYLEACRIGEEFRRIGEHLVNLKKKNRVAILVSNASLTALKWFGIDETGEGKGELTYNQVVYWLYDALYRMNIGCDFIWPESEALDRYDTILVPALYAVSDETLLRLQEFARRGGKLIVTFKSCFADESCKISHEVQPRILGRTLGVRYHQFALPVDVGLEGPLLDKPGQARGFMELLIPDPDTQVLASYVHPAWGRYAAVTRKGNAVYLGCMTDDDTLCAVLRSVIEGAGEAPAHHAGVIERSGVNDLGKTVRFFLNYSWQEKTALYSGKAGKDLLSGEDVAPGDALTVGPWDLRIVKEI